MWGARLLPQRARRALERRRGGNLVHRGARVEDRHADDASVERIELARHDRLQRRHDRASGENRVVSLMRPRRVRGLPVDIDLKAVARCKERSAPRLQHSERHPGEVVQPVDATNGWPLGPCVERAILDHATPAGAAFLRGLEEEPHRIRKLTLQGEALQNARGAHEDRGVAVVAARMHASLGARLPCGTSLLDDWKPVDVRPEADRLRASAREERDRARSSPPARRRARSARHRARRGSGRTCGLPRSRSRDGCAVPGAAAPHPRSLLRQARGRGREVRHSRSGPCADGSRKAAAKACAMGAPRWRAGSARGRLSS